MLYGPNGQAIRKITDDMIIEALSDHEVRLGALAAQAIHLGIMVEYLTDMCIRYVPDFTISQEEFAHFREARIQEMRQQSMDQQQARREALAAAEQIAAEQGIQSLNMDEIEDIDE